MVVGWGWGWRGWGGGFGEGGSLGGEARSAGMTWEWDLKW